MSDLKYYGYFLLGKMKKQFFRAYPETDAQYKRSLICMIISNAFITTSNVLSNSTFLVLLMTRLGMSDGNMGLVLTFYNFANLAQLISIKLSGRIVKNKLFVFIFELQRILFGFLFFLPLTGLGNNVSVIILVIINCYAQICIYICNPASIDWTDSLVDEEQRGRYYAIRQGVTAALSLTVSFAMGIVVDLLKDKNPDLLFWILGLSVIFFQAVGLIAMLLTKEKRTSVIDETGHEVVGSLVQKRNLKKQLQVDISITKEFANAMKTKNFRRLLLVDCLWWAAHNFSVPYNTSYIVNDLNISYTFISAFSFVSCFSQMFLGPKFGKIADKKGTAKVTAIMVLLMALSAIFMVLAVPSNGIWMVAISKIVFAISSAFVNVGLLDIKLERITAEKRIIMLSFLGIGSGVLAYFVSFIVSKFIDAFQAYADTTGKFIGYAQQYTNAVGVIGFIILAIYLYNEFNKKEKDE